MRFRLVLDIGSKREFRVAFYHGVDAQGRLVPVNLTGATVTFFLVDGDWQVLGSSAGSVVDAVGGVCAFQLPASLTAGLSPGDYIGQFRIVWSSDQQNPMRINGLVRLVGGAVP